MRIEKDAVIVLLRQLLLTKPHLREAIKSSREELFMLLARVYAFDELRRELPFEKEEIDELFDALVEKHSPNLSSERLQRFFAQIMQTAEHLTANLEFRHIVAVSLIEAMKARLKDD